MIIAAVLITASATVGVLILGGDEPSQREPRPLRTGSSCADNVNGLPRLRAGYEVVPIRQRAVDDGPAVRSGQVFEGGRPVGVTAVVPLNAPGAPGGRFLAGVERELRAQGARPSRIDLGPTSGITTPTASDDGTVIITHGKCQGYSTTAADLEAARRITLAVLRADAGSVEKGR